MNFIYQNSCNLSEEQKQKCMNISKFYGLQDLYKQSNI